MDEKLKRQLVGGAVLLLALVIVIKWLGSGADPETGASETLTQTRETRVYDLSQLDTEGPVASAPGASNEEAAMPADTEDAAEGLPPAPAPAASAPPRPAPPPPSEPVLAPPEPPAAAASVTEPVTKPKPAAAANGNWIVQVGSYSSEPNAQALQSKLQKQGYATELAAVMLDGRPMYRLRVGPYAAEDAAREAAGRLEEALRQKVSVMRR